MLISRSIRDRKGRRRRAGRLALVAAVAAGACAIAGPAGAHGFGQRYDLPLPLSLYLFATAAAVVLSFVIVGVLVGPASHAEPRARPELVFRTGRTIARAGLLLKLVALAVLVVTIAAGLCGDQNPYRNIAPTLVWVVWWVGLVFFSAFVGNIWGAINPWRTVFEWIERGHESASGDSAPAPRWRYPRALGAWPAVALLLAFSWLELVFPSPAVPANIAWLALGYSVLTWVGMFLFGRETWLRHGEVFTVFFGLFARFAPIEVRDAGPQAREWALRPFGAGLLGSEPASPSMVAFVLLVLATVLYDGLLTTPEWAEVERGLSSFWPDPGPFRPIAIRTAGLIVFWMLFLGAFVAVGAIMSAAVSKRLSPRDVVQRFAFTLVPIAIGYHLAHYLVFFLIQGQYIIPLASDPFGFGWNIFGTAAYRVDIAVVGARFAWYAAVSAIVLGHVAAVYLAHARAIGLLDARGAALRCEAPLTALMVVYTFVSLSILAEPIVERRAPARPTANVAVAIPADAVLPQPGSGRLLAVGAGKLAQLNLTYRVLGSAFHDGTRTTAADLLYAYMFAYRWGVRSEAGERDYDPSIDTATAEMRRRLAGLRVVGTDTASKSFRVGDVTFVRELFVIEVYAAMTPEDAEQDAAVAPPWSTLPWHVIVLMEEAVRRGWGAFSQAEAARRGVEWLDLARSDATNRRLVALVETFEREGYRPDQLRALVGIDEARQRWGALAAHYRGHGHFLVTNGPYRLKRWSDDRVTLEVFRDLSYPLGVGSYDAYAVPRRAYITKVVQEDGGLRLFADIETLMKFQRSYRIVREPLQSVSPDARRRAVPECRYVVTDGDGRIVAAGAVPPIGDGTFQVNLRGNLQAGRYTVLAEVIVNGNAMNVDIQRIPVIISSGP